ncbi:MAG: hypothetical protein JO193_05180 [Candidatus Eremiobacteraeota bacterium]|nr:hypothetical protein [Candidatus Eremiobacteraeota bacterium]
MRSAATFAIATSRVRMLWPIAAILLVTSGIAGAAIQVLQPLTTRIAANALLTSLMAIIVAYANGAATRNDPFAAVEEAAPLFGRQRARANAIVPAAIVLACAIAQYAGAMWRVNGGFTFVSLAIDAAAALTALPIALSVPLRTPLNGLLYAIFAMAAALLCAAFGSAVGNSTQSDLAAVTASIAVAVMIGFLTLRQYGETLARYDPVP